MEQFETTKPLQKLKNNVTCMAFNKKNNFLFCGTTKGVIEVLDTTNPYKLIPIHSWQCGTGCEIIALLFAPKRDLLFVLTQTNKPMRFSNNHTSWNVRAGEIEVWHVKDPTNPTLLNTFVSITGGIPFLASDFFGSFALDGEEKFLFLSSLDGAIAILDITNPDKFQWVHSLTVIIGSDMQCQDPRALAFDNSTKLLISGWHGQQNGGVDIRDLKDPENPQYINYCYNDNEQSCLPFTAVALNQTFLCAGSEDTFINIWNIKDPKNPIPIPTLTAHKDSISSLVFWGDFLVSGSNDGIIKIWNLEDQKNPQCIQTLEGKLEKGFVSFAFDSTRDILFAASKNGIIKIWRQIVKTSFSKNYKALYGKYEKANKFDMKILFKT